MSKIVLLPSVAKEYLLEKFAWRRSQKFYSVFKFSVVFCLLILVVWVYAYTITQASTSWYFLEQAKSELEDLQFAKNVEEIWVIRKKKVLRENMNLQYNDSWFNGHWKNFVVVNTHPNEYVYNE